jgi:hypothetical protein
VQCSPHRPRRALEDARSRALAALAAERAARAEEQRAMDESCALVQATQDQLTERFQGASARRALQPTRRPSSMAAKAQLRRPRRWRRSSSTRGRRPSTCLVAPLTEALEKVDGKLTELDQSRSGRREPWGPASAPWPSRRIRSASRPSASSARSVLQHPRPRGEVQLRRSRSWRAWWTAATSPSRPGGGEGGTLCAGSGRPSPRREAGGGGQQGPALQAYLDAHQAATDRQACAPRPAHCRDCRRHVRS